MEKAEVPRGVQPWQSVCVGGHISGHSMPLTINSPAVNHTSSQCNVEMASYRVSPGVVVCLSFFFFAVLQVELRWRFTIARPRSA